MTPPAVQQLLAALHEPVGRDDDLLRRLTEAEWTAVADLALGLRVGPFLRSRRGLPLPEGINAILRQRFEATTRRALIHQAALKELANRLAAEGIPVIALKGVHLAQSVYPSLGLREMTDIDVLVRPEHLEAVVKVGRDLGYRQHIEIPTALALKTMYELPNLIRGQVGIDVHWRLGRPGDPPAVEPSELWDRAVPSALAGNIAALSPEDALLHVCTHATHPLPFEQGIRALIDVLMMVSQWGPTLSWETVVDRAGAWRCERGVALVLTLAHARLGAPVPRWVLDRSGLRRPPSAILDLAIAQATSDTKQIRATPEAAGRMVERSTFKRKIRMVVDTVLLPDEQMATFYRWHRPTRLSRAIAVPARALSLVRRYGWRLLTAGLRRQDGVRVALDRRHALTDWVREK